MAHVLREETRKNSEKIVILRTTLPQYFYAGPEYPIGYYTDLPGFVNYIKEHKSCLNQTFDKNHWTNFFLEKFSKEYGFKFLDSAPLYTDRWDLVHYGKIDCTHFCYTPEIAVPEIALLTQLLP